ncbi:hypothetical protein DFH07DRAFT_768247 [Mycena maculata]|uniref:Uncharacterized protein n=1 Tax=Mycena maculata TaxID=230809 RepID=A0AAD7NQT8_9AGAR|nr:hypothetical protein DFH07DRAFT_768247 [Mycena maculata]
MVIVMKSQFVTPVTPSLQNTATLAQEKKLKRQKVFYMMQWSPHNLPEAQVEKGAQNTDVSPIDDEHTKGSRIENGVKTLQRRERKSKYVPIVQIRPIGQNSIPGRMRVFASEGTINEYDFFAAEEWVNRQHKGFGKSPPLRGTVSSFAGNGRI